MEADKIDRPSDNHGDEGKLAPTLDHGLDVEGEDEERREDLITIIGIINSNQDVKRDIVAHNQSKTFPRITSI